jgi:hypothetical protein
MNVSGHATPQPERMPKWLRLLLGVPLALFGGVVSLSLGCFAFGFIIFRMGGGRPEPAAMGILVFWIFLGALPLGLGIRILHTQHIRRRFWWWSIAAMSVLFFVAAIDGTAGPTNWHHAFRKEIPTTSDAANFKQTIVSPHLEVAVVPGTNLLWCGTMQLAWNEACRISGGDLQFQDQPPMVPIMNKHSFAKDALDEASYVAMAGLVKDKIHQKIREAVEAKFGSDYKPRLIPDKSLTPNPDDMVAYALLYKQLSFPSAFEKMDEQFTFGQTPVSAFGFRDHKQGIEDLYKQVVVLSYEDSDNFIIELTTKSEGDRLILAKVKPGAMLQNTVEVVNGRIEQGQSEAATTNDVLLVPRIKLDVTRRYSEIEGLHFRPKGTNVSKDLWLRSAAQAILFEMNEKGVELKSEAHMALGCEKSSEPEKKHIMIFDKPFLLMLQRRGVQTPYLVLWVDNPEVLVSWR